ncbi:MAG: hypothetical protein KAH17_01505 [Bacteroidales bacterium]|nr:hypothetical protein [Bacteroidales bacterium]
MRYLFHSFIILLLVSCSSPKSGSIKDKTISIDPAESCILGTISIESLNSSFQEFYYRNPLDHFDSWSEHWICGDKIVFYTKEGDKWEDHYFAVISLNTSELINFFSVNLKWDYPKMVQFCEASNQLFVFFRGGVIAKHDIIKNETIIINVDGNILTSGRIDQKTMIVLGKEINGDQETPFLLEISENGVISKKRLLQEFVRTNCTYFNKESLITYNNRLYWFCISDYSLYEINDDLELAKVFRLEFPGLISWAEISDPYIFDPIHKSKYSSRTGILKPINLISNYLVFSIMQNKKNYSVLINMNNYKYEVAEGFYTFSDYNGRCFAPINTSAGGVSSLAIKHSNKQLIFSDTKLIPQLNGPSAIYVK